MRNNRFGTAFSSMIVSVVMLASTAARAEEFFPSIGERLYPAPAGSAPAAKVSLQDLIRGRAPAPIVLSSPAADPVSVPVPVSAPVSVPDPVPAPVAEAPAVAVPSAAPADRKPMSLRELADYLARTRGEASASVSGPSSVPVAAPASAEPLAEIAAPSVAASVPETSSPVAADVPDPTPAIGAAIDVNAAPAETGTMLPRHIEVATTETAPASESAGKKDPSSPFTEKDPAFAGSDLFVGRSVKAPTETYRVEIGLAGQIVPLNLVLASNRNALIDSGVSAACKNSTDPNCATQAATYAGQAINVINSIPDGQWDGVVAASGDPTALAKTLKSVGVTSASDIAAVQKYLSTIPSAKRTQAIMLARRLEGADASIRLEPYANVDLKHAQIRLGVPMSVGVGSGQSFDMGNLNVDLATGWTFPVKHASFGVSIGLQTYLPTSTGSEGISLMADLFQSSKYLYGYMSFAPYVTAGVDAKWVSLQVHADLWVQARVRSISAASNAEVFQYGTGLTLLPHFPVSVIGQLEGLEGLHNAGAFRSLFVVAGLQFNLWYVRLGVAAQVPIVDRAREDLGTYAGMDVGGLAKYTILARTAASF